MFNQDKNCTCLLVEDRLSFAPSPPKKTETLHSVMLNKKQLTSQNMGYETTMKDIVLWLP